MIARRCLMCTKNMTTERTIARRVHSIILRIWIGVFFVGVGMFVLGELLAARLL